MQNPNKTEILSAIGYSAEVVLAEFKRRKVTDNASYEEMQKRATTKIENIDDMEV